MPMPLSKACIVRQSEGETPRVTGGLFRMVATGTTNGGTYVLAEYRTGPGVGAPPHRHKSEDEAFYVLEGRYLLQVEDQRHEIGPGDFAYFPRGTVHAFKSIADIPSRVLVLLTPAGSERFYREVGQLPDPPPVDRLVAIAAKYQIEIVGPPL
jgi:quercetin dioxygenase-like cupin family protein